MFSSSLSAYLQIIQATMILATILCCVGFFVFILQLFRLKQGERFVFTAIIQLLSGEFMPTIYILNHLYQHICDFSVIAYVYASQLVITQVKSGLESPWSGWFCN